MPYDPSGNFTRLHNWGSDRDAGIKIMADRHDDEDNNFAGALNQVLLRNGSVPLGGDLQMAGYRILGVAQGSAAAPSIMFNTDPNSGLFQPAAGQIGVSITGIQVGLFTSNVFTVNGTVYSQNNIIQTDNPQMQLRAANGAGNAWRVISTSTAAGPGDFHIQSSTDNFVSTGADVAIGPNGTLCVGNAVVTHGTNSFLQVYGDMSFMRGASVNFNAYNDGTNWRASGAGYALTMGFNASSGVFALYNTPATIAAGAVVPFSTRFQINPDGSTSVNGDLYALANVWPSGHVIMRDQQYVYTPYNGATNTNTVRCGLQLDGANQKLNLVSGGQTRCVLQTNGDMQINTPGVGFYTQAPSNGGMVVMGGNATNSGYIRFLDPAGRSLGYIGYITAAAGTHINYVTENSYGAPGGHNFGSQALYAGSYNPPSDRRLKVNIAPASIDSGALFDALEIVQYDWKDTGKHHSFGIIAQDLYEVFPEAVTPADENLDQWSYDLAKMLMLALVEIKMLRGRVHALEGRH